MKLFLRVRDKIAISLAGFRSGPCDVQGVRLCASTLPCVLLAILLWAPHLNARRPLIVIDPGHGGIDSGATVQSSRESVLALEMAQALKLFLESNSAFEVQLTRESDQTMGLDRRVQIANSRNASLFLSLHLNSHQESQIQGTEFYIMGSMDSDEEALFLAHQENRVRDSLETVENGQDGGAASPPRASDLAAILKDLGKINETERSYQWARALRSRCRAEFSGRSCKLRQAPFRVLSATEMPSVLVEMGFITNPEDRILLGESKGQEKMIRSLGRATMEFIERLDKTMPYVHSLPHENRRPPDKRNAKNSTDSALHEVR